MKLLKRIFNRRRELEQERDRLRQERDYLLLWLGGFKQQLSGLSADALTVVAFTGKGPHNYPRDLGDLGRCERAYNAMPSHLQQRALPLLEEWREGVQRAEAERARRA